MSRKILICQHVAYELLGTLNPLLKREGFRIKYVNFGRHPHQRPCMDDYDGLIVLGGPMNCDEIEKHPNLAYEVELIQKAIAQKKPVLGICLGAQLMARALNAKVVANKEKEIGWCPLELTEDGKLDPILGPLHGTERIFQWHGDTFNIPEGATHLASSPLCLNQAFKYGESAYALQFHLEVDAAMIFRWLEIQGNQTDLENLQGKMSPQMIAEDTKQFITSLTTKGEQVFKAWMNLFGEKKKSFKLWW